MWYYDQSILTDWLKSLPKPIAIMACDDNQGNILLQACELCGLHVPYDVAVIGVDNDEILCKQLTVDGILDIHAGTNPRHIEEKLKAYVADYQRVNFGEGGEGGEGKKGKKKKK